MATISYLFVDPDASTPTADPVRRDTKSVGDRSEAMVLAAPVRKGYLCSIPFGENHRYDLVADDGTRLYKVQVKTGRLRNGVVSVNCCSSHGHRRPGRGTTRPYFGEADFIGIYCPQLQKVYLLPESEFVATTAHLRVAPTVNRQGKSVRWTADYELA